MRSLSAVRLQEASLSEVADQKASSQTTSGGSASGQAEGAKERTIYFIYSNATVKVKHKAVPTPQAKLSASVYKDLFGGGSMRVGVLARYFTLRKINVTEVTPKENRAYNGLTAPIVVVKDSSGKKVAALRGKVSDSALASAMITALRKDKINGSQIVAKGTAALNVIRKMIDEQARLRTNMAMLDKRLRGEKGAKAASLQRRQAQMKAEMEKVEKLLKDAYDQLENATKSA
jgi:hypothetical protein